MFSLAIIALCLTIILTIRSLFIYRSQPMPSQIKRLAVLLASVLLLLLLTKKLHILGLLAAGLIPFLQKLITLASRFSPLIGQAGHFYRKRSKQSTQESNQQRTNIDQKMTVDEAWEVLGLEPGASKEQIIQQHRKLIQKLHPDRGGSSYLSTRINQARDLLLNKG